MIRDNCVKYAVEAPTTAANVFKFCAMRLEYTWRATGVTGGEDRLHSTIRWSEAQIKSFHRQELESVQSGVDRL